MKYKATVIRENYTKSKEFSSISEASRWLDSENINLDATTMIEAFDEAGNKKEGFFYTEKA